MARALIVLMWASSTVDSCKMRKGTKVHVQIACEWVFHRDVKINTSGNKKGFYLTNISDTWSLPYYKCWCYHVPDENTVKARKNINSSRCNNDLGLGKGPQTLISKPDIPTGVHLWRNTDAVAGSISGCCEQLMCGRLFLCQTDSDPWVPGPTGCSI